MRRNMRSSTVLAFAGLAQIAALSSLGCITGCNNTMEILDDEERRRKDMAMPVDMADPPRDMANPPRDMSDPPRDMSDPPRDMADPPRDMADPPRDMTMPPMDMAMPPMDMAMPPMDMAMPPVDMSTPPPDMSTPPVDMTTTYTCRGADAPGSLYQTVTDALRLPASSGSRTYNYDYDGSGRPKNQLKALVSLVAIVGLDLQGPIDMAVKNGLTLQLASLKTASLTGSTCTGVSVIPAKPATMPPKFDGTDMLQRAMTMPANLIGSIAASKLTTKASKDLSPSEDAVLDLQINIGAMVMTLPIHGLHLEGTVERLAGITRIKDGVMHGVIAATDIDTRILPAIATMVTTLINSDPMSSTTKTIISLFEDTSKPASAMKCMTPSKCCKTSPATCVILPAEVKASPIGGIVAPDVEVFDSMGNWKPVRGGMSPNGMTIGVGFSTVTATYP